MSNSDSVNKYWLIAAGIVGTPILVVALLVGRYSVHRAEERRFEERTADEFVQILNTVVGVVPPDMGFQVSTSPSADGSSGKNVDGIEYFPSGGFTFRAPLAGPQSTVSSVNILETTTQFLLPELIKKGWMERNRDCEADDFKAQMIVRLTKLVNGKPFELQVALAGYPANREIFEYGDRMFPPLLQLDYSVVHGPAVSQADAGPSNCDGINLVWPTGPHSDPKHCPNLCSYQ
jgi:hypothetical protein